MRPVYFWLIAIVVGCQQAATAKLDEEGAKKQIEWMKNQAASYWRHGNYAAANSVLDSLYLSARNHPHFSVLVAWYQCKGFAHGVARNYDSAFYFSRKALNLAEEQDSNHLSVAASKTNLSILYANHRQYDSALLYGYEGYLMAKAIDTNEYAMATLNMAYLYNDIGDKENQFKYLKEGLSIAIRPELRSLFAHDLARYYESINQVDSAILFYNETLKFNAFNAPVVEALKLQNKATVLILEEAPDKAILLLKEAIEINRRLRVNNVEPYKAIAKAFAEQGKFDHSNLYLDTVLRMIKTGSTLDLEPVVFQEMAENFYKSGRYKEGYAYIDSAYHALIRNDSINLRKKATEIETRFTIETKNNQIAALATAHTAQQKISRQRMAIIFILCVTFLFLILVGVLLVRRRTLQLQLQEFYLQQWMLISQMQPHFINNTMSVLLGYIRQQKFDLASRYIEKFSNLLRRILQQARQNFIQLGDEIMALRDYLDLQSMNFNQQFEFGIHLVNLEESGDVYVPPLLIQPFVENAIFHGLAKRNYTGYVKVVFEKQGKTLFCTIEDNGAGMGNDIKFRENSSTRIAARRLSIMEKQLRVKAKLTILPMGNESGVLVKIQLPLLKKADLNRGEDEPGAMSFEGNK